MGKFNYTLILIAVVLSACSTTKYLAFGQKLYDGGEVKIDKKDIDSKNVTKSEAKDISSDLQTQLRPKPNGKILGFNGLSFGFMIKAALTKGVV